MSDVTWWVALDTKVFPTKCCRLGPSFIELHKVNLTIQISLYVLETIQGYVSLLSPVKQSKGSKWCLTQFFVMDILIDSEKKFCVVCFSKDRYRVFKELNDSAATGCTIKCYRQPQIVILINDKSSIINPLMPGGNKKVT